MAADSAMTRLEAVVRMGILPGGCALARSGGGVLERGKGEGGTQAVLRRVFVYIPLGWIFLSSGGALCFALPVEMRRCGTRL